MGRRSINTTKSGKYMNPTDQARKEARKQELKKNKKQRQMVRAAVLKGKDPQQILEEMEKIDQMEYNVNQPSPLNEKVLKDKRKKLRDTLDRVLSMYVSWVFISEVVRWGDDGRGFFQYKDDPDKWSDLKRRQTDYEHKRNQLVAFYESVRSAQQVQVDEIPLPQLPQQPTSAPPAQIPLPIERKQEHTIYSIATALKLQALGQPVREPPGCPPGPPPDINDDGEVEHFLPTTTSSEEEKNEAAAAATDESTHDSEPVKPTSLQQKMVALSGQNVDDFMKEMEVVQKKLETKDDENRAKPANNPPEPLVPPGTDLIGQPQPINPPPPLLYPGLRLPPGPPPGRPLLPPGPPPGLPPPRMPIRMPPVPPRIIRLPGGPPPSLGGGGPNLPLGTPNVLSAAPQLIGRLESTKQGATITAKPQIRNLSADITRFVPSTLRVKREDKKQKPNTRALVHELRQKEYHLRQNSHPERHTKDDAYKQFMEEMQTLL